MKHPHLAAAAITGAILIAGMSHITPAIQSQSSWQNAYAIDGDTFGINSTHYRIRSMDAPEMPGHCKGYRAAHNTCAAGDPYASKTALENLLASSSFTCTTAGFDVYKRTLVDCTTNGHSVAQTLIDAGFAQPYTYKGR